MCSLETYKVDLKALTDEETCLEYDVDDSFFKALDCSEVEHGALHVSVSIRKTTGFFEFVFHTEGTVTVTCDLCLDDMEQPISTDNRLTVKLGTANAEDDDLVTIDENDGTFDMAWHVYEFIALAIPIKHVHAPGKCNSAMTELLAEHSGAVRSGEGEPAAIDLRWQALLKLKD